ncbi:hypothetical protein EDC02_7851 [Micromonospora sp. Llam0]|uniref:hypothetical protein n=1 Tax=Micromonospora sp. Llam0 TaxID=2485143 RepID=UPI000FAB0087|nr:hypothetical protein [Micromonospora sp. Llam0]ROO52900.1 hypothetical protein EDC02_7851 [Micromonospora sp. Llam0]
MTDRLGQQARRFPLVARPRPTCTPLAERVTDLQRRAVTAACNRDTAAATSVFNLAALLASDCGLPDLARQWSARLARVSLARPPRDVRSATHSLEPLINLARLRTRAGDGAGAWMTLERLYLAVTTRTDINIDGVTVPASRLLPDRTEHRDLRRWLWAVLLSSGAHALAAAGRWDDAHRRLEHHRGIGRRMLDGRQIAVIANAAAGRHNQALSLLHDTEPGETWEQAVTACLTLLCRQNPTHTDRSRAVHAFQTLSTTAAGLAVFRTRLGLCLTDALGAAHQPVTRSIIIDIYRHAAHDGYAARDLLTHPVASEVLTEQQMRQLSNRVDACGLDAAELPDSTLAQLTQALDIAESVLTPTTQGEEGNRSTRHPGDHHGHPSTAPDRATFPSIPRRLGG